MRHLAIGWVLGVSAAASCGGGSGSDSPAPLGTGGGGGGGPSAGAGGGSSPTNLGVCQVVATKTLAAGTGLPSITWTGGSYLALWSAAGDIRGVRIGGDGNPTGGEIGVADAPNTGAYPRAAALDDGQDGAFVVYENCADAACPNGGTASVRGLPLGGPDAEVSAAAAVQRRPHVATLGGKVFVAFRDVDGGKVVSRVARVGASSAAIEGAPTTLGGGATAEYPALAVGGDRLAVAYVRGGNAVVVASFDGGLGMQGESAKLNGDAAVTNPAIAWTGGSWLAAWEDQRKSAQPELDAPVMANTVSGTSPGSEQILDNKDGNWPAVVSGGGMSAIAFYSGRNVYLARTTASGAPDGSSLQVSADGESRFPAVAHNPVANELGMVWSSGKSGVQFARINCK